MKILYIGLKWDYGKKEQGPSFEQMNIEAGLRQCANDGMFDLKVLHPDDMSKDELRQRMADLILSSAPPDIIWQVPFNDHIDVPHEMLRLAKLKDIICIDWECDASWKFDNFILGRRDLYTHFITTHSSTIPWYQKHGMKVIKSQWAGSPIYQRDPSIEKKYDITLIGQKHGIRPQIVSAIHNAGIDLHLFGRYWDDGFRNNHGYIDFEDMIKIFQQSRICLNLSAPWSGQGLAQLKARVWEITQLGQFQLTTPADDLENYFIPDKEIVIANSITDLIDKIKYYLVHDEERETIAQAGYERTQRDHQWSNRIVDILKEVGLS